MNKNILKIIFFGTPEFSIPALLELINSDYRPTLVVTQPDKPAGRNLALSYSPIKKLALDNNLLLAQPKNRKELITLLKDLKPDLGVLAAFGQILPPQVLNSFEYGILNIHPSLLPKYRGSSPIQTAILNGDNKTGVSIIKLVDELDAGPIVAQEKIDLDLTENAEILHDKLSKMGAQLLIKVIPDYLAGKIEIVQQDHSQATFTRNFEKQDGLIDWQDSALQIERKFRAFYPWPGVFTFLDGKRLKIAKLSVLKPILETILPPGSVFLTKNNELAVYCKPGAVIIDRLGLEGKKVLEAKDFILGNKIIGKILK